MSESLTSGRPNLKLTADQRVQWLRLYRSQNVGRVSFRDLISHFGSAAAAVDALPDLAKRGGSAAKIKVCSEEQATKEIERVERFGAEFVTIADPCFPSLLKKCDYCPPVICVKGNLETLNRKTISIVGSRNASIAGKKLTERLSSELGSNGYVTVSGLARGIDAAAHSASLSSQTIAVFAGGIDVIAPEQHEELAKQILDNQGCWISEQPFGWEPRAQDFPKRNRIIAGFSQATLVIEAARRSGSLITARLANEMGRQVLAVPGFPLDPRSEGTNKLIREGATLITSADDILESLTPIFDRQTQYLPLEQGEENDGWETAQEEPKHLPQSSQEAHDEIARTLSSSPISIDDIIHFTEIEAAMVQSVLLELQLAGRLERHAGNKVSLLW